MALIPNAHKVHDYKVTFNGFAAQMTTNEVDLLKSREDVLAVWEDTLLKPQTDSTRSFLNLDGGLGTWAREATGENVVIASLDRGVHPEHPSLADRPTPAFGDRGANIAYGPVPESFTGVGCDFGDVEANVNDLPFNCNNKLIKAQAFLEGFGEANIAEGEFHSARDSDAHGTHTATIAAGNFGVRGSINDEPIGILSGVAPRARLAVYKVCWGGANPDDTGCALSDAVAAIDQAVADGVDVINYSLGDPSGTLLNTPDSIAFLNAAEAGVFVAVSAGNSGPGSATVGMPASVPWVTTVASVNDDESFGAGLQLNTPANLAGILDGVEGSSSMQLAGNAAISAEIVAADPLIGCSPLKNTRAISGNIALIATGGTCLYSEKYNFAAAAGARAVVLFNDGASLEHSDPFRVSAPGTTIPGIMIGLSDAQQLIGVNGVTATLGSDIQVALVNRQALNSSRGMNRAAPDIIKPDIAAPGVGIIAGVPPASNDGELFAALSGTSFASPHVAGILALLKEKNPDWTPAMAKSALMTTARQNVRKPFDPAIADPFDTGAGFIQPSRVFSPGLVYDAGLRDYQAFLCGLGNQAGIPDTIITPAICTELRRQGLSFDPSDLNLPSIGIAALIDRQTVTRTVTNVAPDTRTYRVLIEAPTGFQVEVSPQAMRIESGKTASYTVTFKTTENTVREQWQFGSLTWMDDVVDNVSNARSPIAVRATPVVVADARPAEAGSQPSL